MRRGGLGLLLVLVVALLIAYLLMGHLRDRVTQEETGTPQSDPVQQAQQVVDLFNQQAQQAVGQSD